MDSLPVLDATLLDGPRPTTSLRARRAPLTDPAEQLRLLDALSLDGGPTGAARFNDDLKASGWPGGITPKPLEIVQINVGKLCNMTCRHCHVDAGPDRQGEVMTRETAEQVVGFIDRLMDAPDSAVHTIDLTGGAPEVNPQFEFLVEAGAQRGLHVIDRCNLTILLTGPYKHLPEWLAERGVEVACSLPHVRKRGTDAQRGDGTYEKSMRALRRLNEAGYGQGDPRRILTIVTNPVGAFVAGSQASQETEWKQYLQREHAVTFDRLFALNNMPISRYLEWLVEKGQLEAYMERLLAAFNPGAIAGLMCRDTISISWDGRLFDCDFNQMLEMEADVKAPHVEHVDLHDWVQRRIVTGRHCYGCTAGSGSSCGGATA